MPLLRWPTEVIGTVAADAFSGGASTVYFGRTGNDVFYAQPGLLAGGLNSLDPLFIGGSGNDTYILANDSEVVIAEGGSSASDVVVATGLGLSRTTTYVFIVDGRHLAAGDLATGQSVIVLDWQAPQSRIETIVLADGTFSFFQIQSAIFSSPNFLGYFNWEFLNFGYSTADINEAIGFYSSRATFLETKHPSVVTPTAAAFSLPHHQSVAVSTRFSVTDPDGDAITFYNFFDAGVGGGAFTIGGVLQPANQILLVPAANLASVGYRAGSAQNTEMVYVRAYDAVDWSEWAGWEMTSVNGPPQLIPAAPEVLVSTGQAVAVSSLFVYADPDGDPLVWVDLYDSTPAGGYLRIGGAIQPAQTVIRVQAAQMASTEYVGGATPTAVPVAELLYGNASDGVNASGWAYTTMLSRRATNTLPIIDAPARSIDQGQWRQVTEDIALFTASDADGDPAFQYEITDLSGGASSAYFYSNGVIQAQGASAIVNAADLVNVWVNGGADLSANGFAIRVTDGYAAGTWGAATTLTLTTRAQGNRAPVVRVPNNAVGGGLAVGVPTLWTLADADGDAAFAVELYDAGAAGGQFRIGGAPQSALTVIRIPAAQLASTEYVGGATAGVESLYARVYDGQAWSEWANWQMYTQTRPSNALPVISAPARNIDQGQWRQVTEDIALFTVSDANGDPIDQYQITDLTGGASSAYFYANGVIQAQGASAIVNAADLANVWVNGGADLAANGFAIRAFDTFGWSSSSTLTLTTRPQANRAPVVVAEDAAVVTATAVAAGSLWAYSDVDADAPFAIELYDAGAAGGQFRIGGAPQSALTVIRIPAAQLPSTEYVGGAVKGSETLYVRVYDGQTWSEWDSWLMRTLRATNALPVVSATSQVLAPAQWSTPLTSFVSATDGDLDPIVQWEIQDLSATAGSSIFYANGVIQPQGALVTTADLGATYVQGGTNVGTDSYQIRGLDSEGGWSAWAPFSVWTDRAPIVSARTGGASVDVSNHVVPVSFFFTVTDPDGHALQNYELYDGGAGGGQVRIGGIGQPAQQMIPITAAQLAQTEYVGGGGDGFEYLYVRASDGGLWSPWTPWGMYTVMATIRLPEVLGDENANVFNATFTDTVFFGRGGNDTFNTSGSSSAVFIGGPGDDTYRFFADNTGTLVADGSSGSTGDVADLSAMGWAFGNPNAIAGLIDGRHLFLGHVTPVIQTGAIFIDWQLPAQRIETWQLWGGGTYTFDQMAAALAGAPSMTWEQAGLPTAQINEAITYYGLREMALAAP